MKPKMILAGGTGFLGQTGPGYFESRGFEIVILTRVVQPAHLTGRAVVWNALSLGSWQEEMDGATVLMNEDLRGRRGET